MGVRSEHSFLNNLYARYVNGARRRGIPFSLSKKLFNKLMTSDCFYCGNEPNSDSYKFDRVKYRSDVKINGIDRKDNNKGYSRYNCVPCCQKCNYFKHDIHVKHFKNRILKLAKRAHKW